MVGERPHGLQQELSDGTERADRHPCRQVLLGQIEDAGAGRQLDVKRGLVVLHAEDYQLERHFFFKISVQRRQMRN